MDQEQTERPQLMIRVPKFINLEGTARPLIKIEPSPPMDTVSPQNISKRDILYFKFKKVVVHSNKIAHTLFVLHSDLKRRKHIPQQVLDHFHPLHVLSPRWWNTTHSYIYFYPDVREVISELVGCVGCG